MSRLQETPAGRDGLAAKRRGPPMKPFRASATLSRTTAAYCDTAVAIAAPTMPCFGTSAQSPTKFSPAPNATESMGVTVSRAPMHAACATHPARAAGSARARMRTYAAARGTNSGGAAAPAYSAVSGAALRKMAAPKTTPETVARARPIVVARAALSTSASPVPMAVATMFVVATLRKTSNVRSESEMVLAGPKAARATDDVRPTKAASMSVMSGPAT
mmetsp:Transcript_18299/g.61711  ORF Transcript_18299/g.61711 Transcript_18299/m.61711 type:complete len:218 (-) Transcript_18299:175-828(-)